MTTDAGGNPRFKGPGTLWKTSWRGKHPYTGMPFFDRWKNNPQGGFDHYQTVPGGGLPGNVNGFWIGTVIFIRPFAIGANIPASFGDPAAPLGGWVISVVVTGPTVSISFSVSDGITFSTTTVLVPTALAFSTPDSVEPALVIPVLGVYNAPHNFITVYAAKPTLTVDNAFAGPYVSPAAGFTTMAADFSGTNGSPNIGINGLVGGSGIPTAVDAAAWFAAVEANLKTSSIPGITDRLWAANDWIAADEQAVPAPGKIFDEIANETMTLIAPPNIVEIIRYSVIFDY